jgi:hypothetical protein
MTLSWPGDTSSGPDTPWLLPNGLVVVSPPPERFAIDVARVGKDLYAVSLVWNRTCLHWSALTRTALLPTALPLILDALGTDLRYLLEQPFTLPSHICTHRAD